MGTNMMARMAQYKFLWVPLAAKRCITTSQLPNLLRPKFCCEDLQNCFVCGLSSQFHNGNHFVINNIMFNK